MPTIRVTELEMLPIKHGWAGGMMEYWSDGTMGCAGGKRGDSGEHFMMGEGFGQNDLKDTITRRGYRFVALWAVGILFLYGIAGYLGVRKPQAYKAETEKFQQTWIESTTTDLMFTVALTETEGKEGAPIVTIPAG